jgi:SAM-dependent methyltransferase
MDECDTNMSHPEQLKWFTAVRQAVQIPLSDMTVVEVGSADVYGSVREIFRGAGNYIGLDLAPGPGVDLVVPGDVIPLESGSVDLVISAEAMEHDPNWYQTMGECMRILRPGGLLIVSCAGEGRPEHGTRRTDAQESPGTQGIGLDHYGNLSRSDMVSAVEKSADPHRLWFFFNPLVRDNYLAVLKSGPNEVLAPDALDRFDVAEINRGIDPLRWVAWSPIRLSIATGGVEFTDRWSWRYWNLIRRVRR